MKSCKCCIQTSNQQGLTAPLGQAAHHDRAQEAESLHLGSCPSLARVPCTRAYMIWNLTVSATPRCLLLFFSISTGQSSLVLVQDYNSLCPLSLPVSFCFSPICPPHNSHCPLKSHHFPLLLRIFQWQPLRFSRPSSS